MYFRLSNLGIARMDLRNWELGNWPIQGLILQRIVIPLLFCLHFSGFPSSIQQCFPTGCENHECIHLEIPDVGNYLRKTNTSMSLRNKIQRSFSFSSVRKWTFTCVLWHFTLSAVPLSANTLSFLWRAKRVSRGSFLRAFTNWAKSDRVGKKLIEV